MSTGCVPFCCRRENRSTTPDTLPLCVKCFQSFQQYGLGHCFLAVDFWTAVCQHSLMDSFLLVLQGGSAINDSTIVLEHGNSEDTYVFTDVPDKPVPSILRDFSAPVNVTVEGQTDEDLLLMFAHDSDPFNRCDGNALTKEAYPTWPWRGALQHPCSDTYGSATVDWENEEWMRMASNEKWEQAVFAGPCRPWMDPHWIPLRCIPLIIIAFRTSRGPVLSFSS